MFAAIACNEDKKVNEQLEKANLFKKFFYMYSRTRFLDEKQMFADDLYFSTAKCVVKG